MQAVAVFLALVAAASAGGITGYSTGNYVQHAHAVHAVAAPVAYAGPIGAPLAVAPVAKAIAPAAISSAFVNRAPAARIAVAAPVAVAHAVPAFAPAVYGAPALLG